eukprot:scaffold68580_cov48-Phaeocystis_antarctica.AAC.1
MLGALTQDIDGLLRANKAGNLRYSPAKTKPDVFSVRPRRAARDISVSSEKLDHVSSSLDAVGRTD